MKWSTVGLLALLSLILLAGTVPADDEGRDALGRPVTIMFSNRDIGLVVKALSQFGGVDVKVSDQVQGKVSLKVVKIPVRTCLENVARLAGAALQSGDAGLRIVPLDEVPEQERRALVQKDRRLSVTFTDRDAAHVIASIAAFTNASVFYPAGIEGQVTCEFKDIPWREALQRVADQVGLEVIDGDHGVVRLAPRH